jgi:hypothetical protein
MIGVEFHKVDEVAGLVGMFEVLADFDGNLETLALLDRVRCADHRNVLLFQICHLLGVALFGCVDAAEEVVFAFGRFAAIL